MRKPAPALFLPVAALLALAATGCSSNAAPSPAASAPAAASLSIEKPWVRATEGATDTTMTAAYMTLTNPGDTDARLVGAESPVAGMTQVHEMATVDGKMVMREAVEGVRIPAGSHEHLAPGGPHIMLMQLKSPLKVGDEVEVTVRFADGTQQVVRAPVKKFTEEEDQYHTHAPATPATS